MSSISSESPSGEGSTLLCRLRKAQPASLCRSWEPFGTRRVRVRPGRAQAGGVASARGCRGGSAAIGRAVQLGEAANAVGEDSGVDSAARPAETVARPGRAARHVASHGVSLRAYFRIRMIPSGVGPWEVTKARRLGGRASQHRHEEPCPGGPPAPGAVRQRPFRCSPRSSGRYQPQLVAHPCSRSREVVQTGGKVDKCGWSSLTVEVTTGASHTAAARAMDEPGSAGSRSRLTPCDSWSE